MAVWDNDPRVRRVEPAQTGASPQAPWLNDPRVAPVLLRPPVGQPSGMFAREFHDIGMGALHGLANGSALALDLATLSPDFPTLKEADKLGGNPWAAAATDPLNLITGGPLKGIIGDVLRNIFTSETATSGGEVAKQMVQGSGQPLAQAAGAIAGGLTAHGAVSAFSPAARSVSLAQGALGRDDAGKLRANGISDKEALSAAAAAREAEALGVTTVPGQHLPNGALWHETQRLAKSPYGSETQARLEAQPGQIKKLADDIGRHGNLPDNARIPGDVGELTTVSNNAMGAFDKMFGTMRKARQNAFKSALVQGEKMPEQHMAAAEAQLKALREQYDKQPSAQAIIDDALDAFRPTKQPQASSIVLPNGQPAIPAKVAYFDDPAEFNIKLQSALDGEGSTFTKLSQGLNQRIDSRVVKQISDIAGEMFDKSGSSIKAAKAAYRKYSDETYTPAMKFLNRFTRGGNFDPTLPANAGAYAKLFKDGIPEYLGDVEMSNFKNFARLLNEQGPEGQEAFRDLFRTILGQDLAKATERAGTDIGEEAYKTGSKTREAVGVPGTGRQRTIDEGLRMVYEGAGYSPQDAAAAVAGMNKVRRVLTAAGNFPPQINSSPQGEIAEGLRQSGWFNRMAEAAATTITWAVSKAEKLTGIEKANRLLDQLISDPARMQDLIDLAKTNRWPKRLTDLMLTVDTMARNPRNPSTDSKESPNAVLR